MIYIFFRVLFVPLAFAGWLIWELFIKKKKWSMIRQDAFVGCCYILLATFIYYWLSK